MSSSSSSAPAPTGGTPSSEVTDSGGTDSESTPPDTDVEHRPADADRSVTAGWFRRWSAGVRGAHDARVPF